MSWHVHVHVIIHFFIKTNGYLVPRSTERTAIKTKSKEQIVHVKLINRKRECKFIQCNQAKLAVKCWETKHIVHQLPGKRTIVVSYPWRFVGILIDCIHSSAKSRSWRYCHFEIRIRSCREPQKWSSFSHFLTAHSYL